MDQTYVRIDKDKKTTIPVPRLNQVVSSPDKLLTNNSYIIIQNNSSFTFSLVRASNILSPDNFSGTGVNPGERARYTLSGNDSRNVSLYHLSENARRIDFPSALVNFEGGLVYSFVYDGSGLSLFSILEIKLDNILTRSLKEMVRINGGMFSMRRQVTLSAFWMGKYQVTQEQYLAVMNVNPSYFTTAITGENASKLPVERVSWFDAVEFCNKLSQLEGLTSVYTITGRTPATGYSITAATVTANWSANGYRLPTEAEWEYACRAGSTTDWHFGNTESNLVNYAWYSANSGSRTHQVGLKLPNAFRLYDMHGNVDEWCWDWYDTFPSGAVTDPR